MDHPSQIQHGVCLMMDIDDRVDLCLEDALNLVNFNKVVKLCKLHLRYLEPQYKLLADQISKDWIKDTVLSDKLVLKHNVLEYIHMD